MSLLTPTNTSRNPFRHKGLRHAKFSQKGEMLHGVKRALVL